MNPHLSRTFGSVVLTIAATASTAATALPTAAATTTSALHAVQIASTSSASPAKLRDPRANLAAAPEFHTLCATAGPQNPTCIKDALAAINAAHAAEGVRKMILPKNYAQLTLPEQTFVVTNLERVDRGMRPILGLTAMLNGSARRAAVANADPTLLGSILSLLGIREYASIWAGDFGPLASDYDWMYNDGYSPGGSINIDCHKPGDSGCWGHRHAILGLFSGLRTLLAGAGSAGSNGSSLTEVFVGATVSAPALTFSWLDALANGANGHKVTA